MRTVRGSSRTSRARSGGGEWLGAWFDNSRSSRSRRPACSRRSTASSHRRARGARRCRWHRFGLRRRERPRRGRRRPRPRPASPVHPRAATVTMRAGLSTIRTSVRASFGARQVLEPEDSLARPPSAVARNARLSKPRLVVRENEGPVRLGGRGSELIVQRDVTRAPATGRPDASTTIPLIHGPAFIAGGTTACPASAVWGVEARRAASPRWLLPRRPWRRRRHQPP